MWLIIAQKITVSARTPRPTWPRKNRSAEPSPKIAGSPTSGHDIVPKSDESGSESSLFLEDKVNTLSSKIQKYIPRQWHQQSNQYGVHWKLTHKHGECGASKRKSNRKSRSTLKYILPTRGQQNLAAIPAKRQRTPHLVYNVKWDESTFIIILYYILIDRSGLSSLLFDL